MRLKIDNFAKIKHADLLIDGITVIAGKNNTGKSTIGKVLYSMFNSLYDLDINIENRREEEIFRICSRYIRNLFMHAKVRLEKSSSITNNRRVYDNIAKELTKTIVEMDNSMFNERMYKELFVDNCLKNGVELKYDYIEDYVQSTFDDILLCKNNDDYKIALEIIQRFFMQIFGNQIQCLKKKDTVAQIQLTIKNKDVCIEFEESQCIKWTADYNILHEAFLLDDPFLLDDLSEYYFFMTSSKGMRGQLKEKLDIAENDIMEGLFDAVKAKENLKDIYEILNQVTEGDIAVQNGQWRLNSEQFERPINFENLSAGLKSFVLIKLLLEKGILREKDVLILDEPEIHLHPEWQLFYAEIIILLQKKFDLSIVVTTHSVHFLEAIEYYSKKHGLEAKCHYYMSNLEDGLAVFEDVTMSLNKIYKQMVTPNMLLDKLKYDMVEDDE